MNLLVPVREYFKILVVIVLNLVFLLILMFSNIFIPVEQSNKRRIKNGNGTCFKTLYYILHNLTYANWNELYSNNLTYHTDIFNLRLRIQGSLIFPNGIGCSRLRL